MTVIERCCVGDILEPLSVGPLSRTTLALYAGSSGDRNPVHIDLDVARAAGFEDVFAHGMLSMAFLARLVRRNFPDGCLLQLKTRFTAITHVHDVVTCTGEVIERLDVDGEVHLRIKLTATTQRGEDTLRGEALLAHRGAT